ncbi:modification methylase [bacterium]|nr:modification methylase [Clostridia bacterium]MBQ4078103.1 modification methylase [bacterium]
MFKENIEYEVENLPTEVNGKTFIINQSNPNKYTHSYFKYPCKFIPEIPKWAILNFSKPGDIVFDPFAGSGTTLVESILNDRIGLGTEIDQVAKLLIKTKTTRLTTSELAETEQHFNNIIKCVNSDKSSLIIPKINNIDHWYNETNKIQLGKILHYIGNIEKSNIKNFFLTCFVSIVKKTSNADDVSPKPYVSTKIKKKVNLAIDEFSSTYKRYFKEICNFSKLDINQYVDIIDGDALSFSINKLIDLAVTSPPYINAFDYVRTMRLENLWLETSTEETLKETKKRYVGTESIKLQYELDNLSILACSDLLKDYFNQIIQKDKKRACIVKKFFEDMLTNLQRVYSSLKENSKYVIVIGNSTIRKVEIESWKVLKELAENIGFSYEGVFRYKIKNPYIRIPRKNRGGQVIYDYVLILNKEKKNGTKK